MIGSIHRLLCAGRAVRRLVVLGWLCALAAIGSCREQFEPGRPARAHGFYSQSNPEDCLKACHTRRPYDAPPPSRCLTPACHGALAGRIAARQGFHGQGEVQARLVSGVCSGGCHQEHLVTGEIVPEPFASLAAAELATVRTEHESFAGLALTGGHARPACADCHARKNSLGHTRFLFPIAQRCVSCHPENESHWPAGQLAASPARRPLRGACERCHEAARFQQTRRPMQFEHGRDTEFSLLGKHAVLSCKTPACHEGAPPQFLVPVKRYADCTPCHQNVHGGTYGISRCSSCHSAQAPFRSVLPFDHDRETRFPLEGPHRVKQCSSCHRDQAQGVPDTDCGPCHRQRSPHGALFATRFPRCGSCHSGATWQESSFQHARLTRFPLASSRDQAGHHAESLPDCTKCHFAFRERSFKSYTSLLGRPRTAGSAPGAGRAPDAAVRCAGCHRHEEEHHGKAPELPCAKCHRPGDRRMLLCSDRGSERCLLEQAGIGHGEGKSFRLVGGHSLARLGKRCLACHKDTSFAPVSSLCIDCHARDNPHGLTLGDRCDRCHAYAAGKWQRLPNFAHGQVFDLAGRHADPQACAGCHPRELGPKARFKGRPRLCSAPECHGKPAAPRGDAHQGRNGATCDLSGCHQPKHGTFRCLALSADKASCPL